MKRKIIVLLQATFILTLLFLLVAAFRRGRSNFLVDGARERSSLYGWMHMSGGEPTKTLGMSESESLRHFTDARQLYDLLTIDKEMTLTNRRIINLQASS